MTTKYTETLGEWVKNKGLPQRETNAAAFLAALDDIRSALACGYAMTTVWLNLSEAKRIGFSYETFVKYVHAYIGKPDRKRKKFVPVADVKSRTSARPLPSTSSEGGSTGFVYNPIPNKEELI